MPDPFVVAVAEVEAAVVAAGFRPSSDAAGLRQWRGDDRGAIQVVEVQATPTSRRARRRRPTASRVETWVGVVHPVVDLAFGRHTPDPVSIALDAHVRRPVDGSVADGLAWLDRHVDPRAALGEGVAVDPFVTLEIAALVGDVPAGEAAAVAARAIAADETDPERRRQLEVRWREAVTRLHAA